MTGGNEAPPQDALTKRRNARRMGGNPLEALFGVRPETASAAPLLPVTPSAMPQQGSNGEEKSPAAEPPSKVESSDKKDKSSHAVGGERDSDRPRGKKKAKAKAKRIVPRELPKATTRAELMKEPQAVLPATPKEVKPAVAKLPDEPTRSEATTAVVAPPPPVQPQNKPEIPASSGIAPLLPREDNWIKGGVEMLEGDLEKIKALAWWNRTKNKYYMQAVLNSHFNDIDNLDSIILKWRADSNVQLEQVKRRKPKSRSDRED